MSREPVMIDGKEVFTLDAQEGAVYRDRTGKRVLCLGDAEMFAADLKVVVVKYLDLPKAGKRRGVQLEPLGEGLLPRPAGDGRCQAPAGGLKPSLNAGARCPGPPRRPLLLRQGRAVIFSTCGSTLPPSRFFQKGDSRLGIAEIIALVFVRQVAVALKNVCNVGASARSTRPAGSLEAGPVADTVAQAAAKGLTLATGRVRRLADPRRGRADGREDYAAWVQGLPLPTP